MNTRQLRYFECIARLRSFSAAADALHIAQSALSRHMKELEEELGGPLFDRGPRGISLSESGQVLLERARFILSQIEEARTEVLAHNRELLGTVRLMTPSSIGQILFEPLVERFLGRHPKVQLHLSEGLWADATARLQNGDVDLAILSTSSPGDQIDLTPLASEQMVLIGRRGDPLMKRRSIAVDGLAGLPLMLPQATLDRLQRSLPKGASALQASIYVESSSAVRALAASGHGYAVVPRSVLMGNIEDRRLIGVPIRGFSTLRQLAMGRGRPRSRALWELAKAIREEFDGFVARGLMSPP